PLELRAGAAQRLATSEDSDVLAAFAGAILGADAARLEAVASGAGLAGTMPPEVMPAVLTHACETGGLSSAHVAILRVGRPWVTEILKEALLDGDQSCRLMAIEALAAMNDRQSVEVLVQFLDAFGPQAPEFKAIDAGLRTYAGVNAARSVRQWQDWWLELEKPAGGSEAVSMLEGRLRDAIERAEFAEQRGERLARRLAETIARLVAIMPETDRATKVVELAGDEEAVVRLAAVDQVERMLRNGRIPSDEIRDAMLQRINDTEPVIRIRAAKMLDAMGLADLGPRLVEAIGDESDPAVLAAVLEILGNRPVPGIVPIAVGLFNSSEPAVTQAAAGAVAAVGRAGLFDMEMAELVRDGLAQRVDGVDSGALAEVAILAAADPEDDLALGLLTHPNDSIRRGAAEGMRARGVRTRLLVEASDPVIARVAIMAWADPPWDLDSVDALLALRPAEEAEADFAEWLEAMGEVLSSMPPQLVVQADSKLAAEEALFPARRAALRRAAMANEMGETNQLAAARQLADRLVAAGLPIEAAQELQAAGASPASPLGEDLFRTLLLAESWQEAAAVRPDAQPWLDALEAQVATSPESAGNLLLEIDRRFGENLEPSQKTSLEAARRVLGPAAEGSDDAATAAVGDEPAGSSGAR
ncbi:MAG: HEAT repeat domain-containing protein, partial [Phycisphaerales bacterium]|nr:HEAT repeat domain-containing protein [Phycisphaerales bacterium]